MLGILYVLELYRPCKKRAFFFLFHESEIRAFDLKTSSSFLREHFGRVVANCRFVGSCCLTDDVCCWGRMFRNVKLGSVM